MRVCHIAKQLQHWPDNILQHWAVSPLYNWIDVSNIKYLAPTKTATATLANFTVTFLMDALGNKCLSGIGVTVELWAPRPLCETWAIFFQDCGYNYQLSHWQCTYSQSAVLWH